MYHVLYLVNHKTYKSKMSRVRFHGIHALSKVSKLTYSGIGWNNYDSKLTVQQNIDKMGIKFDLVIAYKPLELLKFKNIKPLKCIRYNEMYNFVETLSEIEKSNADIVICHHENDMKTYKSYYSNYHGQKNKTVEFYHIPHCTEKTIFKDYKQHKDIDILLAGKVGGKNSLKEQHYPLRLRFQELIPELSKKFKVHQYQHVGYNVTNADENHTQIEFAKMLNRAKICLTCSGLPKSRFGKYIEIPSCNSVVAGDIPDQDQDDFKQFVIEINLNMSNQEIIDKISYYLNNQSEFKKIQEQGYKWSQLYSQEWYATELITILNRKFKVEEINSSPEPERQLPKVKSPIINYDNQEITQEESKPLTPIEEEINNVSPDLGPDTNYKIFIQGEESKYDWIIDTLKKEYSKYSKHQIVKNYSNADIIWLLADYKYKAIPENVLKNKYVITTIHHIDKDKINEKNFKFLNSITNKYHTISKIGEIELKKYTEQEIITYPFWINDNNWFEIKDKDKLKQEFKIKSDTFLIGSFQRDTEGKELKQNVIKPKLSKGPDILIEVIKEYQKKYSNIEVVLTGFRRQYVIQELEKINVKYYYFENQSYENLNKLYNLLDLYVVSSRVEGGPRAILETIFTKTPLISTNVGIASEYLPKSAIYQNPNESINCKCDLEYSSKSLELLKLEQCIKYYDSNIIIKN
jgi:hypothetical protein